MSSLHSPHAPKTQKLQFQRQALLPFWPWVQQRLITVANNSLQRHEGEEDRFAAHPIKSRCAALRSKDPRTLYMDEAVQLVINWLNLASSRGTPALARGSGGTPQYC